MMERTDRRPILSAKSNRIEPTFVPEWLKSTSNHVSGSSFPSDDRVRNRPPVNGCEYDSLHSSLATERNSTSLRRSSSTNGSPFNERERAIHLRPYSSFGRSNREKDTNSLDRRKPSLLEDGGNVFPDFSPSSRFENDVTKRFNSTAYARSSASIVKSIGKSSFERDFPSLGSEEVGRVTSPSLISAVQTLPLGSALVGGDSWTSALAEVPTIVGSNGPPLTSMSSLNMAEAVAQAPLQARIVPKLDVETQRLEELAIKQSRQLVPVASSTSKALVLGTSEKLKPKVSRGIDFGASSKAGTQPVGHALRVSKPSQGGNFHVLNRERKNGILSVARDSHSPIAHSSRAKAAVSQPGTPVIERRPPVAQQNRTEFFNSLRKKNSMGNPSSSLGPALEKPDGLEIVNDSVSKGESLPDSSHGTALELPHEEVSESCLHSNEEEKEKGSCLDPEEEERLLRLFGWKENAGEEEEALTAEEIDAFMEEYQKRRPSSKFGLRNLHLPAVSGSGNSVQSSESSQAEGL